MKGEKQMTVRRCLGERPREEIVRVVGEGRVVYSDSSSWPPCFVVSQERWKNSKVAIAHGSVGGLLLLVAFLVSGSLGLVRGLLLLAEVLPLLAEHLANLACEGQSAYA